MRLGGRSVERGISTEGEKQEACFRASRWEQEHGLGRRVLASESSNWVTGTLSLDPSLGGHGGLRDMYGVFSYVHVLVEVVSG